LSGFKIITDSASDLPSSYLKQHDIGMVPFYITADGNTYLRDKIEIDTDEFYKRQRERKQFFKTSLPSVQDYVDEFSKYGADTDILCLCLSSGLSGSHQSAMNAANILKEENPQRNIIAIDSFTASLGYGMKVIEAVKCREKGKTAEQAANLLSKNWAEIALAVDDLEYLLMGGRVSKVQAFAGGLLNIKPVIRMTGGKLVPHTKVRGRSKVMAALIQILDEGIGQDPSAYKLTVMHSDCHEDAEALRAQIEERYNKKGEVLMEPVGLVIGVHVGPAVLAVAYLKDTEI